MTSTGQFVVGRHSVDEIVDEYLATGFKPDFGPEATKLLVRLYRELAVTAQPVRLNRVLSIAEEIGMGKEDALRFLDGTTERGDAGEVRGIVGLSLNDHPHRLKVNGNTLQTWCALDPLFIVPALGKPAVIESNDPLSKGSVRVSIEADGSILSEPVDALLSLVIPERSLSLESVEDTWMQFCQHVHFFVSTENAERFLSDREGRFELVSVKDGFEIARRLMAEIYQ